MQDWADRPHDLTRWILDQRPAKNPPDVNHAYGAFVERERDADGRLLNVATLLLSNRECTFHCLMCDLWRNTLDDPTPRGAIPTQIRSALASLTHVQSRTERRSASSAVESQGPPAQVIKLYNAGNFFDAKAIPPTDWPEIAELVDSFERVIVESHPKLIGPPALTFRDMLPGRLEVAIGLETVHEGVLERLNKQMTLADFEQSVRWLRAHEIDVRAFILLRPPFLSEREGVEWARRSMDFAFSIGVQCCVVVPTRGHNGAMERLQARGYFEPPKLRSMEETLEHGLCPRRGRAFIDLWDIERFYECKDCDALRAERLRGMNLSQTVPPRVECGCEAAP